MKQKRALSVLVLAAISVSAGVVQGAETGAKFIGVGPINAEVTTGSNIDGSGATGANALAIGVAAQAKAINGTAIGVAALADTTNATAIGNGAKVNNEGGSAIGGIAIGTNAHSHNMSNGNHESIIIFGRDKAALTGGIAIGQDTHARIGNVELGNRDYRGQIGDFDFSTTDGKIGGTAIDNSGKLKNSDVTTGVGSTTVGDNSFNMGNFSSINGSYNVISKAYDKPTAFWVGNQLTRGANALHNAGAAIQGFGSSISGSLNSIEGNESLNADISSLLGNPSDPVSGLMYSGTASNIVGTANRISKSNGALIFGTGNEITNSYITPNSPIIMDSLSTNVPFLGTLSLKPTVASNSIKELADTLRKYSQDNRMGSVGIMGGANKADYALFSTISGVGNTLTGAGATNNTNLDSENTKLATVIDGNTFAAFNAITGYENTGKVVSHSYINGSYNNLENATENIVIGNNQTLKGTEGSKAKGNIILGFRDKKDETALKNTLLNAVAIGNESSIAGDNTIAIGYKASSGVENGVAIGNDSSIAGDNAIAIGYKASSGVENGVALGSQTVAGIVAGISGYDPVTGKASVETDKIWKSTLGAVSVGNDDNTRQITNLAAGMAPTDAVNVAQLQAVSGMIVKPTISIFSKGTKSDTTYVGGSAVVTSHDVNGMIFDFGDGLYAEKQKNTDGKDIILVGVDKNVIKPGVDGAPGTPGIPGKDGTVVEVSKNEETGETTITTNPDTAEKNSVVVKNGKDGKDGKDGVFDFSITADKTVTPITVAKDTPLVQVHGDSNIQTIANGNTLTVSLNKDITVNSVTTKTIQAESYKVGDATYINEQGLNANNKVIKNVAAGEDITDAANVGQLRELNNTVSQSMHKLQKDSNRADAMGAALAALSPLQYDPLEPTQIMAGYGYYGGENAFALGLAHYKHESLLFRAGVAMNGGNSKLMANAGITWKFGDSKKERALVEEYRQGPISSSYVLQDKVDYLENLVEKQQEQLILQEERLKLQEAKLNELMQQFAK